MKPIDDLFDDAPPADTPPPVPPETIPPMQDDDDGESILLHDSAARDYLEYAVAVVKGRARWTGL